MVNRLTVIVGTNREGSVSKRVALQYSNILRSKGAEVSIVDLEQLPETFAFSELYGKRSSNVADLIEKNISNCEKFVFVIPEYNGGFPGVLKTFIDAVPPGEWSGKKAGLIGVSSGRAGAARAMDQFTNVLNYLKVNVFYSKPKLSGISALLNEAKAEIEDDITLRQLDNHAEDVIDF